METKTICGIYIIKNNINDLVYIGQSVDIKARFCAHKQSAKNVKAQDHYTQIHQAMYLLGIENFYYEVLEECPFDKLDEREIYYISLYDSYNNGYNMTLGGEGNKYEANGRAILTLEQVQEIRLMYGARIPLRDAYKRYKGIISKRGFKKVWHYETWRGVFPEVYTDDNLKWHSTYAKRSVDGNNSLGRNNTERACSDEEIAKMRELRTQGLSYEQISERVHRSISVVRKYCLHRGSPNPQAHGKSFPNAIAVRNIETGLVFDSLREACKWAGLAEKNGKHLVAVARKENPNWKTSGHVPTTGEPAHWELA